MAVSSLLDTILFHPEATCEAGLALVHLVLAFLSRRNMPHLVAYTLAALLAGALAACAVGH